MFGLFLVGGGFDVDDVFPVTMTTDVIIVGRVCVVMFYCSLPSFSFAIVFVLVSIAQYFV